MPQNGRLQAVSSPMPISRIIFFLVFAALIRVAAGADHPRLNLIAIVTDDQAEWSLGCYGNKESITPNMDRLAKEGARFANAYTVTPVCSASRASYMTGFWNTQLAITDWIAPNEQHAGVGLPQGTITWPQVLQQNGWTTALVGKWHLGEKPHNVPTQTGFDHFYGFLGGGNTPMNPTYDFPEGPKKLSGYGGDLLTDEAIRWIGEQKEKPFVLCLHFREPHLPYGPVPAVDHDALKNLDPTVPQLKGLDIQQVKGWTRDYYAAIHSVDRNMGRLFDYLDKQGLWEKTIISFTSDHGYNIGHHMIHTKGNGYWVAGGVNGPKRPNMWDTSVRIPWMVRWPGVVKPGTIVEQPVQNLDTFATMLGMLGAPMPKGSKQLGKDVSPLLRGESSAPPHDVIFGQYDLHNSGLAYLRMVRTDRWKYVKHFHENLMDELYDLKADPGETKNLINMRKATKENVREVIAGLRGKLHAWQKSIDDPVLSEPRLMDYEVTEDKE
jgi:uncharacterized sulfatase